MGVKGVLVVLVVLLIYTLQSSHAEEDYVPPVKDCMDATFCSLIQGDIAKISDKYGKDPSKYYKEAENLVAKSKTKDDATLKSCQDSYKTCTDEAAKMAVEGVNFPEDYRTKCDFTSYPRNIFGCKNMLDWPRAVTKEMPDRLMRCAAECLVDGEKNYTLSNGKVLRGWHATDDRINTDSPDAAESRYRWSQWNLAVNQATDRSGANVWLSSSDNVDLKDPGWGVGSNGTFGPGGVKDYGEDLCPRGTWVNGVDNFYRATKPGTFPTLQFGLSCVERFAVENVIYAYVLSKTGTELVTWTNNTKGLPVDDNQFSGYYSSKTYEKCPGNTWMTAVSLTTQTIDTPPYKGDGIGWFNFKCQNSNEWVLSPSRKVDSRNMECPEGHGVCGFHTKTTPLGKNKAGVVLEHLTDLRIGCCNFPGVTPYVPPTTPAPVIVKPPPTTGDPEGDEGLFNHQKDFILIWGQVLLERITRYYYFYTPNTIDKEREWETTKCADGTFVNWFEVTNPVSNYFWTRRIFQIKFKCAKPDGSGSNDLDLYQKLTTKWNLTQPETEVTGTNNCANGYYTSIQFTYYLDKPRIKLALVNAWGLTMKCSKGRAIEPHKHLINSTPRNKPEENEAKSGEVDCGTGKAICGFSHKIFDGTKGAFEGVYYKVICCSV